ncbi:MAG: hypothetical protein S4CHLAM6_11050 [Chlamydiae bacterium]|nr:hypothetical protein [Chlamydiota bacterium]
MIHPYTAVGSVLGGLGGAALGFVSKDLELTFAQALGNKVSKNFNPSYIKTVVPAALKDKTFWKITLAGAALGAFFGEGTSRAQSLATLLLS